jgi:hypothetical protein
LKELTSLGHAYYTILGFMNFGLQMQADISSLLAKKNEPEEQIVLKVMKLQLKSKALQMR